MFCPKCGKENPNDAKICASCGAKLQKSNKLLIIAIIIALVVLGIIIVVAVSSNKPSTTQPVSVEENKPKKDNPSPTPFKDSKLEEKTVTIPFADYVSFEFVGYNGAGAINQVSVDWTGISDKYEDSVRLKEGAEGLSISAMSSYIQLSFERPYTLSNGDTIEYTWIVDPAFYAVFDVDGNFGAGAATVSGLTEPEYYNPFDDIKPCFDGVSGYVFLRNFDDSGSSILTILTFDVEGYAERIPFELEPQNVYLKNGDKFTVSVTKGQELSWLRNYGIAFTELSHEYTVSGLSEAYEDISQFSDEQLQQFAEKTTTYLVNDKGKESELKYVGCYYHYCPITHGIFSDSDRSPSATLYVILWSEPDKLYYSVLFSNPFEKDGTFDAAIRWYSDYDSLEYMHQVLSSSSYSDTTVSYSDIFKSISK